MTSIEPIVPRPPAVKMVLLGSDKTGKSSMISVISTGVFPLDPPDRYPPNSTEFCDDDHHLYSIDLWDTLDRSGTEDDRMRPLSYPNVDVFLIFFSAVDPHSMEQVTEKWLPEIDQHMSNTPFVIVCTKVDLRDDASAIQEMQDKYGRDPYPYEEGRELARKLNAQAYMEISSLHKKGLREMCLQAVHASKLTRIAPPPQKKCTLI